MKPFNSRVDGLSYDAILNALVAKALENGAIRKTDDPTNPGLGGDQTMIIRGRARFIAERALEMPYEDRYDFVNHKVWSD